MELRPTNWFQRIAINALRIFAGAAFMQHGVMKLFGWLTDRDPVQLMSLMGLAGVIETFGGLLIVLGLFTRPVAFIASGEMAFAYFMAHAPRGFWPIQNGGEVVVLFCFIFLFLAAFGGGDLSLDALLRRRKPEELSHLPPGPAPESAREKIGA